MQVPGDVFAHVTHAFVLAEVVAQQLAVPADDVGDLAQIGRRRRRGAGERGREVGGTAQAGPGGVAVGRPVNAAESSANSHGRPRQPRPITTPSQPVTAIMVSASLASKMSPLPSTGMVWTCCLSGAICSKSAVPE